MRWQIAYTTALTAGVLTSSGATAAFFVPPSGSTGLARLKLPSKSKLFIGGLGWDNDNFLDSLSKGSEAMKEANDRYRAQSRYTGDLSEDPDDAEDLSDDGVLGAQLTKEMIEKVKASHTPEEEASQGGSMFRELLNRAQQPQRRAPPPPPEAPSTPPVPPAVGNLAAMSVEEQARMFREMMLMQQQSMQNMMVPPPIPQDSASGAVTKEGRRIGRNRDADAIVNTADVYFAQLKRDSTVRNMARYRGDDETANAVFQDPLLKEIKLHTNPYIEEARKKEREMLETSPDEILDPQQLAEASKPVDKSFAGVSYKQKLQEMKTKKGGQKNVSEPEPRVEKAAEAQEAPAAPAAAVASTPPEPTVISPPPQAVAAAIPPEEVKLPEPQRQEPPQAASREPTAVAPQPRVSAPEPRAAAQEPTATAQISPEDTRRDLRTLMGLLLKHRGGPGFGAGRLQGAEKERFESLAAQITNTLQAEVARNPLGAPPKEQQAPPPAAAKPAPQAAVAPPAIPQAPIPQVTVPQAPAETTQAPPAASSTAIEQIPAVPDEERINSMLSCIEGAIQMYKNCPVELKEGVLITMRAALLSAVTTCNEIIAKNELRNFENFRTVTTDVRTRDMRQETTARKPMEFYDVVPQREEQIQVAAPQPTPTVEEHVSAAEPIVSGNDENSQLLQSLYNEIKAAAGAGKMGLRQDITPEEAAALADNLADVRAILVDELQNGIPTSPIQEQPETKSTASKYQEMLAKARADKAANK